MFIGEFGGALFSVASALGKSVVNSISKTEAKDLSVSVLGLLPFSMRCTVRTDKPASSANCS